MSIISGGPIEDEKLPNTVLGELPFARQLDEEELSGFGAPTMLAPRSNAGPTLGLFGKMGRPCGKASGKPNV